MDVKKTTTSTGFKLSVMTLAIMNVTAVVSLRGLPAEAVYGLSSAFYYLFAAIVFLIPTAMVAAELAAMFADKAGRRLPLGRRSLRRTHGIPRHLAAMDRIDDLVSHGADLRRRVDRLHRHEPTCTTRSLASNKVFTLVHGAGHLLARHASSR